MKIVKKSLVRVPGIFSAVEVSGFFHVDGQPMVRFVQFVPPAPLFSLINVSDKRT